MTSTNDNALPILTVLGVALGTYTDWDLADELVYIYYVFTPNKALAASGIPEGGLQIDYTTGEYYIYAEVEAEDPAAEPVELRKGNALDLINTASA